MTPWLRALLTDKLPIALINALILGLIATSITARWQEERKLDDLRLGLLREFEDRSNRLIGCVMAPRAMVLDRECLVVELDLLGMESTFQIVYEASFQQDFEALSTIIAAAHAHTTEGSDWVLPDAAFTEFRIAYTERVQVMRRKMLAELGAT